MAAKVDEEVRKLITPPTTRPARCSSGIATPWSEWWSSCSRPRPSAPMTWPKLFADVPKWEHTAEGAMRIKYPDNPVMPQPREQMAAAEQVDEEEEEPVTESLRLKRSLRPKGRPADAGA